MCLQNVKSEMYKHKNVLLATLVASFYIPILKMAAPPMIVAVSRVRLVAP